MDCREAVAKCAEWKRKFKEERTGRLQAEQRMNAEADRADRAETDYLHSQAELAFARQELAGERKARRRAEGSAARLAARVEKLEKIQKRYDNAHTPPSHRTETQDKIGRGAGAAPSGRKRGAQKGHPGRTSRPKPDKFEEHEMSKCGNCGSRRIRVVGKKIRYVTEAPRPVRATTTCHTVNVYDCAACDSCGMEPETGLPDEGNLGRNACASIVGNFVDRMPHRMNAGRMGRDGLPVSVGTVHNVLARMGRNLGATVGQVAALLMHARALHVDETSFKINGKNAWVWIFLDPQTGNALFVLRRSRGRDVLDEVLAGFKGVIVCDGWKPYNGWRRQRCWAHILREARYLLAARPHSRAAHAILKKLRRIYQIGCDAAARRMSKARRARLRAALLGQVRRLVDRWWGNKVAQKFLGKLEGAADDLFEFVLDPRIQPTNNAAERGLREIVIHRKIRGTLRSEESLINFGNIFTCIATWKNRGLDYMAEIAQYA